MFMCVRLVQTYTFTSDGFRHTLASRICCKADCFFIPNSFMAHFLANVSVILKLGDIIQSFKHLVHVVSTLCLVNKNAL